MDMANGFLQTYWPESNVLIPPEWDPLSEEPDYNCLVRMNALPLKRALQKRIFHRPVVPQILKRDRHQDFY